MGREVRSVRNLKTMKQFENWHSAGVGGGFMGLAIREMSEEELLAVIGYFLLRQKRDQERDNVRTLSTLSRFRQGKG